MQTAHSLHNSIDGIVAHDGSEISGNLCVGKRHILQTQHLGYLHIFSCGNDVIDTPADDAETQQTDFHKPILH